MSLVVGAFVLILAGAASTRRVGSGALGPAGVGEQGIGTAGSPGTWETLSSPRTARREIPGDQLQACAAALHRVGAKSECKLGTGRAKETKPGGKGGRES
jgi:hypothetical protein